MSMIEDKLSKASQKVYNRMTISDQALLDYLTFKIQECVEIERDASERGDTSTMCKITKAYFKLLAYAIALDTKYPATPEELNDYAM